MKISVKVNLSALWASVMFLYTYGDYFAVYVPGKLQGKISGKFVTIETTESVLMAASLLMAIPSVMIFLSLVPAPKINRWLNIVLGIFYCVVLLLSMLMDAWKWPKRVNIQGH